MIEIIWECVAYPQTRAQFELLFGPGGAWSKIVSAQAGFRGTTFLNDTRNPQRYLVIEVWDQESQRPHLQAELHTQLDEFNALLAQCLERRTELGCFVLKTQGAVRPISGTRGRFGQQSAHRRRH